MLIRAFLGISLAFEPANNQNKSSLHLFGPYLPVGSRVNSIKSTNFKSDLNSEKKIRSFYQFCLNLNWYFIAGLRHWNPQKANRRRSKQFTIIENATEDDRLLQKYN